MGTAQEVREQAGVDLDTTAIESGCEAQEVRNGALRLLREALLALHVLATQDQDVQSSPQFLHHQLFVVVGLWMSRRVKRFRRRVQIGKS